MARSAKVGLVFALLLLAGCNGFHNRNGANAPPPPAPPPPPPNGGSL